MSSMGLCDICKHKEVDITGTPCRFCMVSRGKFEIDLSEHDKQIRADEREKVINEVEKMLEELQVLAKLCSFKLKGKELKYGIAYTVADLTERLKELKEQNK